MAKSFRKILIISIIVTSVLPIFAERSMVDLVFRNIKFSEYFAGGRKTLEIDKNTVLFLSLPDGWEKIYVLDTTDQDIDWKEELILFYPHVDSMPLVVKDHIPHFTIRKTECSDERYLGVTSPTIDSLISYTHIMGEYIDIQGLDIDRKTGEKRYVRAISLPHYKLYFDYRNVREEEVDLFNKIFDNIVICNPERKPTITKRRKNILW